MNLDTITVILTKGLKTGLRYIANLTSHISQTILSVGVGIPCCMGTA